MTINLDTVERLRCPCGGWMNKTTDVWKGMVLRAWKCAKCGEAAFHPVDTERALAISRAQKKQPIKVRIRRVGKSLTITVPKLIVDVLSVREGECGKMSVRRLGILSE